MNCFFCKKEVSTGDRVGIREECPHCGRDLHHCKNCLHFDGSAYNECRESSADRVLDKEKANYCDYFSPGSGLTGSGSIDPALEAKRKLEQLFKKAT